MLANYILKVQNFNEARELFDALNYQESVCDEQKQLAVYISPDIEKWKHGVYLVVGDRDVNYTEFVADKAVVLAPGQKIYCEVTNLPELLDSVDHACMAYFNPIHEFRWGSRECIVQLPGGYLLVLWENAAWTDEELLDYYGNLAETLEESIRGLTDVELHLTRAEGKWSIKQNAFHLMDSHLSYPVRIKFALAESGRSWLGNAYDQDVWATELDYINRDLSAELEQFRAAIKNNLALCQHFQDALDRYIMVGNNKATVREMLKLITLHSLEHIERIRETRAIHLV